MAFKISIKLLKQTRKCLTYKLGTCLTYLYLSNRKLRLLLGYVEYLIILSVSVLLSKNNSCSKAQYINFLNWRVFFLNIVSPVWLIKWFNILIFPLYANCEEKKMNRLSDEKTILSDSEIDWSIYGRQAYMYVAIRKQISLYYQ